MGSVLDICPNTDYSKYLPKRKTSSQEFGSFQTDAENLRNDWVKVGDALRHAMSIVNVEKE
ncbi:MAG: hypothetical protein H7844_12920 [Nitrospirae bacterium YQR-1]